MIGVTQGRRGSAALPAMLAALTMLAALSPGLATTANMSDRLAVQAAYVNVRGGVFELNARATYPLNDDIRTALTDGVTVNIELQTVVNRQRRFWFDNTLVDVTLRRELSWHAVSERYILREVGSGTQQVFMTLDQALVAGGEVDDWPVVVEPQLDPDSSYTISVRAGLRRGRMSDALRALIFWSDSWNRSSEWYTWTLPR
jgi:Domain of unknown function (DUF4390)